MLTRRPLLPFEKASGIQDYIIQVAGCTDSSGNTAYNEQLSEDRAEMSSAIYIGRMKFATRGTMPGGILKARKHAART
jgi:hypothetical protein